MKKKMLIDASHKEIIRVANDQYDIQIFNDAKLILGKIDGKDNLIPYDEYKNKIIS